MFGLLRLFSILSLLVIAAGAVGAGLYLRDSAIGDMVAMAEKNSASLSKAYIRDVWTPYREAVLPLASGGKPDARVGEFAQATAAYFQRMPLARVNLYSAGGQLLMSTSATPVFGNSASPDTNFMIEGLRKAQASSHFWSGQTGSGDMALVQTIVPIHLQGSNAEGAIELLYDASAQWRKISDFQIYGIAGVVVMFFLFMAVLYFTTRRAEAIIAKQYETNLELEAAATSALAESREKSQFLANISHELRTPLNAIIGFSEIIKNELLPQVENRKHHEYINDINSSGVHLLSLINDILDYSKAEAGKLELEVSETNASKLVQNCMRLVMPRAEVAKVTLTDAMPKEPFIMTTDSKKFKQILLNLLSNAVKFTPAGGEVRVSAWRDLTDDTCTFEVRDTGIGIAPKDISRAMAPFGQVDSALSRKYEGTGLGLPLTKKFVEIMGGKFTIESELNVGTTIRFTLPRELTERDGLIIKHVS